VVWCGVRGVRREGRGLDIVQRSAVQCGAVQEREEEARREERVVKEPPAPRWKRDRK
jgi:hypothetical protein